MAQCKVSLVMKIGPVIAVPACVMAPCKIALVMKIGTVTAVPAFIMAPCNVALTAKFDPVTCVPASNPHDLAGCKMFCPLVMPTALVTCQVLCMHLPFPRACETKPVNAFCSWLLFSNSIHCCKKK
jgi:hypothetical protein